MKQLCAALIESEGIDCELLTLDAFRTSNTAFRVSGTAWLVARYLKRHGFTALISAKEEANGITAPDQNSLDAIPEYGRHKACPTHQCRHRQQMVRALSISSTCIDKSTTLSPSPTVLRTCAPSLAPNARRPVHSLPNAVIGPNFLTRAEHSIEATLGSRTIDPLWSPRWPFGETKNTWHCLPTHWGVWR